MILFTPDKLHNKKDRPMRTLNLVIEEYPERPQYILRNDKERVKFTKKITSMVRSSEEYREYIKFLKKNMDMSRCEVLRGLEVKYGKRYKIEIHHMPFSLFAIVSTVIRKREALNEPLNPFLVADEVMELHYDEKVGLVPLSTTMHELVENDKIFIPLQYVYQSYNKFYEEYEEYMDQHLKDNISLIVALSLRSEDILSDITDPEFTYVDIDGFSFPEIKPEWKNVFRGIEIIASE